MNSFKRGDECIYITHFPTLKKPVLAVRDGNAIRKIATFDSEVYAERFCDMLNKWFGLEKEVVD